MATTKDAARNTEMKIGNRNQGRRRLGILLSTMSGGLCGLAMIAVLIGYGTPYNSYWYWIMAGILGAAFFCPLLLLPAVEWVIKGYAIDANEREALREKCVER